MAAVGPMTAAAARSLSSWAGCEEGATWTEDSLTRQEYGESGLSY